MLKRFMTVAMVATLMLGTAWAIDVDVNVTPPDWSATDITVDGTGGVPPTYNFVGITNGGTSTTPYAIQGVTLDATGAMNVGLTTTNGRSLQEVWVTIGTLQFGTMATGNTQFRVHEQGHVSITNAVTVDRGTVYLAGGEITFEKGATFTPTGGTNDGVLLVTNDANNTNTAYKAVINTGVDANGKKYAITLAGVGAMVIDGGTVATNMVVDASGADFIVANGTTSASAITWNHNGATSLDLTVGVLDVQGGMVQMGLARTAFTAEETVYVGGETDPRDGRNGFWDSHLRIHNDGGTVTWEKGIVIGAAGTVYTVGSTQPTPPATTLPAVTIKVGTADVEDSGNVILNGSDRYFPAITTPLPAGASYGGLAILDGTGAPIVFDNKDATGRLELYGTLNAIAGSVDTGTTVSNKMDMYVDLYSGSGDPTEPRSGIVNALLDEDFSVLSDFITTIPAPVLDIVDHVSLSAIGDKFRGLAIIGDPIKGNATVVKVGNYEQVSGIVLGTGGLGARGFGFGPIQFGPSQLDIYGTTTVRGGIMAVDSNVGGDMLFNGTSFNSVDTAILAGIGQEITNSTAAFYGATGYKDLSLTIGANALLDTTLAGLTIRGMNTLVDSQGDLAFGTMPIPGVMRPTDMVVSVVSDGTNAVNFSAYNSGSIKFNEGFLKTNFNDPIYVGGSYSPSTPTAAYAVLVENWDAAANAGAGAYDNFVSLNIAPVSFTGLLGTFETTTVVDTVSGAQQYILSNYVANTIDWSGSVTDFADANGQLTMMYGNQTNYGLNQMIYQSFSEEYTSTNEPYDRLYLVDGATTETFWGQSAINSFNMNMRNLQHFAAGRREANGIFNLYNGNAMNGVNMVSQAVARSHIRTSLNRSDEIRETWNLVKNTVTGGDGLASGIMNSCYTNRVWVGGFGLWEDADDRGGLAGYKYKSGGFVVGYDKLIGQNVIVGGSFAYNTGDFEDKAAIGHDSDIDNYSFNLYATYTHCSGFFGTLFAGYTYSDNDISETYLENLNNRVNSQHDNHTNTWVVGGKIGYDWRPNERFSVTPSIGFTYINARSSAHTAYLGGTALGQFSKLKDDAYYLPIEINLGYDVWSCEDAKLNLNLNVGYAYNFDEDGVSGTLGLAGFQNGVPYGVQSREQGHHLFNVGGGVTYSKGRFDFGVKYDYYMQKDADTHRVLGTVGFKF